MIYNRILWMIVCLSLIAGCSSTMSPSEADRSMKILNSNLTNLITISSDKPEIQAVYFLLHENSSPLCLKQKNSSSNSSGVHEKGIFVWNKQTQQFEKQSNSEQVELLFPFDGKGGDSAHFIMNEFEVQACKSRPDFPVSADAVLKMGQKVKLQIEHNATIEDNLPLQINSLFRGDDYLLTFLLHRTRMDQKGDFKCEFKLKNKGFAICSGKIDAKIEYSRAGYYFRHFNFAIKLMDHQIHGTLDYSLIDPTATDYAELFNRHSQIYIEESNAGKVGEIVLGKNGDGELLDYLVEFSNGKQVLLSEYIPLLKKILDFKYD